MFKKELFKIVNDLKISKNELLLLIYFINQENLIFDIPLIKKVTYLEEANLMESFTSLTNKKILSLETFKGNDGKICEKVELSNLYKMIVSNINKSNQKNRSQNVFEIFEKEFGRPLSPIEFEIINAWLKSGINEDLILAALKEATFNGVSNLRYIDKIIYEWNKKGFKNTKDVNKHLTKKESNSEKKELFDYNWLEDDE